MEATRASGPPFPYDPRKWAEMVKQQETQIEYLAKERKFLQDHIKLQSSRWISDIDSLEGKVSQVKRKLTVQEMMNRVDAAKAELLLGFKQKEALIYKTKLDSTLDELSDFKSLYSHMMLLPGTSNMNNNSSSGMLDFKSERDFVWNQYKKMESHLTSRLKNQRNLIENGDAKIRELVANNEKLESSNADKDELILNLKAELAKLEADSMKKDEEVSRLASEVESLRKGTSENKRGIMGGEGRRWKRKASPNSSGPRLFTSRFKIPKLKMSMSPHEFANNLTY